MKLSLVSHTYDPLKVLYTATLVCRNKDIEDVVKKLGVDFDREKAIQLVDRVVAKGHDSILEHVSVTYLVTEISRVATHQLVRHRIASYSQFSHRIQDGDVSFMSPDLSTLGLTEEEEKACRDVVQGSVTLYNILIKKGMSPDFSRYFLPMGIATNILFTMNLRSLKNFLGQRLGVDAYNNPSKEIKDLAGGMLEILPEGIERRWLVDKLE